MNRKKELGFIIEKELNKSRSQFIDLSRGFCNIDNLGESDINDIFKTDRRDGIKKRFLEKVRFF